QNESFHPKLESQPSTNENPESQQTLGWKAFQDLCAHVCEDMLRIPVEVYREAQDGGQDAVFVTKNGQAATSGNATVQCKFSSVASRTLKPGDLKKEIEHVIELKANGHADTYVLMTSMSVSAPTAMHIKSELRTLGVLHPHVFGKEFLVRVIRASTRLRALVPRIYGLGDLSMILDERKAAQTKALLGHILPTLKSYVPTASHVKAVKALATHKIVLLVGDPATGKSTIGAVLSTIAADDPNHRSFKADGPLELIQNWNPEEGGGFYWIDDAFGPNQMREDYVDHWIAIMPKIQTATSAGNRFVLTSRRHIYEAAKPKLGSRNHPLFRDGRAVVDVGDLTVEERRQILYNHVKSGSQPSHWKQYVRQELDALAHELLLTPEIARQIGDRNYTSKIAPTKDGLQRFVRHNKAHLLQTIRELSKPHRAALTLVFIHGGQMPIGAPVPEMQELVIRHYNVDRETLAESLIHLKDSFIVERNDGTRRDWSFKHPTLADALAATLALQL
ncbi:restriction endonuclease, partial [Bradyrhizobium sp. 31Argb]|uniref:nSTAND3 domain-containing NTPase n=1 Tax=Bradyrhizobium sp. 31Argb TaxID=3141247 RepID=UPI00374846D7